MDTVAVVSGAAGAAPLVVTVYVFHASLGQRNASTVVRLPPGDFLVADLRPYITRAVNTITGSEFSIFLLSTSPLFYEDMPSPNDSIVCPSLGSLPEAATVTITAGKCFKLNLGGVPAAAGGDANADMLAAIRSLPAQVATALNPPSSSPGVPAAAGGDANAELLAAIRALPAQVAAALNPPDEESTTSDLGYDLEYGRFVRRMLFGKLVKHCGMETARGTALDRRTLLGEQWGFRAAVRCAGTLGDPRNVDGVFEAFMSEEGYIRPPSIVTRDIMPTKTAGGATVLIAAEYLALLEISDGPNWTRGSRPMLPLLEKQLRLSLERAKAKGYLTAEKTITDLVAVVGVASPYECSDSVCDHMDVHGHEERGELHPFAHLKALMDVGRFVFIRVPKAGSPSANAAGGDASR